MKKIVLLFLAALFIGAAFTLSTPAEAFPRWKFTLDTTDAGPYSVVKAVTPQTRICLQAKRSETCFLMGRSDGGNPPFLPDCTKDFVIGNDGQVAGIGRMYGYYCTDTGQNNAIVVANLDAGAPTTNLYQDELNQPRY